MKRRVNKLLGSTESMIGLSPFRKFTAELMQRTCQESKSPWFDGGSVKPSAFGGRRHPAEGSPGRRRCLYDPRRPGG